MFSILEPAVRNVTVLLTNRCNIACEHCYVSSHPGGHYGLDVPVIKHIIDVCSGMADTPLFTLSGGEPLTRKKDCLEILEYASGCLNVQLLTNGMLITKNIAEQLTRLGVWVRISLDGDTASVNDAIRGKGTFEKIRRGIDLLLSAGFESSRLSICTTIPDINTNIIDRYLTVCETLGIEHIRFHALCRMGRGASLAINQYGEEDPEQLLSNKQTFISSFSAFTREKWRFESLDKTAPSFNEININSDGSVYPYVVYDHLNPRSHERAAGNVNETPFGEILRSEKMSESLLLKFLALNISSKSLSRAFIASRQKAEISSPY